MSFKLIVVMCLLGAAAALNYDYKKPALKLNVSSKSKGYPIGLLQAQSRSGSSGRNVNSARPTSFGHALSVSSGSFGSSSQSSESRNDLRSQGVAATAAEVHYPPAKYQFSYAVNNQANGDIKSHSESRDGDQVRGSYSVIDTDGYKRIVTYTVDGNSGFNAVVTREPYALNSVNKLIAAPAVVKLQEVESTSANAQQLQPLQQPQQFEAQQSQSQSQPKPAQQQQFQSPPLQTLRQVQQFQSQPPQQQQFHSQPIQQQQFQSPPLQTQPQAQQSQPKPPQQQQFQSAPLQTQALPLQSQPQPLKPQQFQSQPFQQQQQFQSAPLQPQSQHQQAQKETRLDLPIQPRDSYASVPAQRVEGPYA